MFSRKERPLPKPVFESVPPPVQNDGAEEEGIFLGENCHWNPAALPNGHVVAIGASGSGKTQTLKAGAKRCERRSSLIPSNRLTLTSKSSSSTFMATRKLREKPAIPYTWHPLTGLTRWW